MAHPPDPRPPRATHGTSIARLWGIEITVHGSWLVWLAILVAIAWQWWVPEVAPGAPPVLAFILAVLMSVPLSLSILFHELSHAAIARAYRLRVRRITLFIFGGVAQIEEPAPRPGAEFRIAVAGPLASLLLGGIFSLVARLHYPGYTGLRGPWGTLAAFNVSLAIFNLLPAFPMDGGRILRSVLWRGWASRARATRWAVAIGKGLAVGLIGLGFAMFAIGSASGAGSFPGDLWTMVLGVFLFNAAGAAGRGEAEDSPGDRDR